MLQGCYTKRMPHRPPGVMQDGPLAGANLQDGVASTAPTVWRLHDLALARSAQIEAGWARQAVGLACRADCGLAAAAHVVYASL